MSAPVITLRPHERAKTIVKILKETNHHGFPIVCPRTNRFLGLVRRDQLVALIEYNVFDNDYDPSSSAGSGNNNDDDSTRTHDSIHSNSEIWTPKPGVGQSRLMNLAYHINDDRYEFAEFDMRGSESGTMLSDILRKDSDDEHDTYSWLNTLRKSMASMPTIDNKLRRPNSRTMLLVADDWLPPLHAKTFKYEDEINKNYDALVYAMEQTSSVNRECATVGTNSEGNVYIRWMNPINTDKWVNIAAVMNQGTFTVTEFCPVSKAHFLFTALGLRHLIVLGGDTGGAVVGIITRINLLKHSVEDRTGYVIQ
jgi:CBS domain-containing protein